jgi:hypothetical protein
LEDPFQQLFLIPNLPRPVLHLVVLSWVIYLALLFSLHPTFLAMPFATLFALTAAVTASTFKKYL